MSQTGIGGAFEFALGEAFSQCLGVPLQELSKSPRKYYNTSREKLSMDQAATKATDFLLINDKTLAGATSVILRSNKAKTNGDVRGVIIRLLNQSVGVSAKTRHKALKHPRLSGSIDFGKEWANCPVSSIYWQGVKPLFQQLEKLRSAGMLFRNVPDKAVRFYSPVLSVFEDEFKRLYQAYGQLFVERVFRYLIGRKDFYRVIRENGYITVRSFNLGGTLQWGKQWAIPQSITQINTPTGSLNTLDVSFDGGWKMTFRLHSASSKVEPSLKFDVNLSGVPPYAVDTQIPLP